jgi:hypothetical protein
MNLAVLMDMKAIFMVLLTVLSGTINCQCDNNLILNGSFELDSIGEAITAQYWISVEGTPDLDNANDNRPQIGNRNWDGQVLSSSDGGNWQNIAYRVNVSGVQQFEIIGQEVTFEKCIPHILEFEFTSQIIETSQTRNGHSAVDVYLDNLLIHTTELDTTVFTWENVKIKFTPVRKESRLEFHINPNLNFEGANIIKYIAIDGVCLRPIPMGMFCKN